MEATTLEEETLGKPVAWQIRDMPEQVRDAVTEQARVEGVKVPELLTRLILDARDHGWTFAGSPRAMPATMPAGNAGASAALVAAVAEWSRADRAYRGVRPRQAPRRLTGPAA